MPYSPAPATPQLHKRECRKPENEQLANSCLLRPPPISAFAVRTQLECHCCEVRFTSIPDIERSRRTSARGTSAADDRRRLCAQKWSLFDVVEMDRPVQARHTLVTASRLTRRRAPAECAVKTVDLFSPRFRRMAEHVALRWGVRKGRVNPESRFIARNGPTSPTVAYSDSPSDSVCRRCSYSRLARAAFSMSIRRCSAS